MKRNVGMIAVTMFTLAVTVACKKNKCHECHYEDASNAEVELGEKCGSELEDLEANGINVDGTNYEVHCHEH